ncbi:dystroglycan-like [Dendronephthya gigantea]|uniref:dystroglycan-like n=1 Tax=Dendronephthya gigantea TaxID=151771 RepID=UPI00106BF51B|nr:dystroglycan-like [Dendronephthya gigantea]
MKTADHESLDDFPWIEFDAKTHTIYALPVDVTIGKYEFLMFAFDSEGLKTVDAFEFHINPTSVAPNHQFGLVLDADFKNFDKSAATRVKLFLEIGNYFGDHFNTSYRDIRVEKYEKVWVKVSLPEPTTVDPNVVGRTDDDDDGTWWEYTIIPAFVVAGLILIIGLEKNENVVFVQRKKPAVFREEYPMREVYGNQPLITPNEKAPLPPPAYPRSSTPTEDPSERLLSDSSPSYQPPFDSGHEPAGNSRPSVASYRLPPPYVAP